MAANLNALSGGRLVLGVGVGWAREKFEALGVQFGRRGALTDEYLDTIRAARRGRLPGRPDSVVDRGKQRGGHAPRSAARRAVASAAIHAGVVAFVAGTVEGGGRRSRAAGPRVDTADRAAPDGRAGDRARARAGEGTIEQITADLEELRLLGAGTVVLDPFGGDPEETRRPQEAWQALATVAAHRDG